MSDIVQMLWRHEAKLTSATDMAARLRSESNEIISQYRAMESQWRSVSQSGGNEFKLRQLFDRQMDSARIALGNSRMRECWEHLEKSRQTLDQLRRAALSAAAIAAAEAAVSKVPFGLPDEFLNYLATLDGATRLLRYSVEQQGCGKYRAAGYSAALAITQLHQYSLSGPTDEEDGSLQGEIASIRAQDTRLLEQLGEAFLDCLFTEALHLVELLIQFNFYGLAQALLMDVGDASHSRASFFREMLRQRRCGSSQTDAELVHQVTTAPSGLRGRLSWRRATRSQLQRHLAGLARCTGLLTAKFAPLDPQQAESP